MTGLGPAKYHGDAAYLQTRCHQCDAQELPAGQIVNRKGETLTVCSDCLGVEGARNRENTRLAALPLCPECKMLIDEQNGDKVFGDYHADCFDELVVRAQRRA